MMLPKGWRRSTLGDIASISSGGTPNRAKPEYWGGDVPWVTTGEIHFNTITSTTERITEAGLKNSSAKLFPPGTLLMAMYGQGKTRGQMAKLSIEAATNQNSAAILLKDEHVPDFYFHYLSSQYENIRNFGHSGGVSHLNAGLLKQIPVPVAPKSEQQRIAQILSTWDQAIALSELLLGRTRKQKRVLIESLLINQKFERDREPSWEQSTLSKVASISVSSVNKKSESNEREVQLCNYTDVYYRDCIDSQVSFMQATASDSEVEKFSLRQGDVIITKDSETAIDIAVAARVIENIPDLVCGYHLALIRPDLSRIDPIFLHCYFSLPKTKNYFSSSANGVTRFGLPLGAIQDAPISFPSLEMQQKIGEIVSNTEREIKALQRDIELLKDQKKTLMTQLLSGKRRVTVSADQHVALA
jgi:type I restriction enzyme, S subunit